MGIDLTGLPQIPAADVKKRGWRGVMRTIMANGPVVVTNHSLPEAVILSAQQYQRLLAIVKENEAKSEASLQGLRHRFDERLAVLQHADAANRLRAISKGATKLHGKVKAGTGY